MKIKDRDQSENRMKNVGIKMCFLPLLFGTMWHNCGCRFVPKVW